jgi:hypothetical protein
MMFKRILTGHLGITGNFGRLLILLTGIAFIITLLFTACTTKLGIERGMKPVARPDVDVKKRGCSIIRTREFDAAVEPIDPGKWEKLLEKNIFSRETKAMIDTRVPRFEFFHVVITNAGNSALRVDSITVSYDKGEIKPLTIEEVLKKCKSQAYSIFNFKSILSPKRITGKGCCCIKDINFDKDIIHYNLDFIAPGERVMQIVAFNWIPVQFRKIKVGIKVTHLDDKALEKDVVFDFDRYEYRTKDESFTNPDRKKKKD